MTEDEVFGWHHRLDGHEFEQALGVGDCNLSGFSIHGILQARILEWVAMPSSR